MLLTNKNSALSPCPHPDAFNFRRSSSLGEYVDFKGNLQSPNLFLNMEELFIKGNVETSPPHTSSTPALCVYCACVMSIWTFSGPPPLLENLRDTFPKIF